MLADTGGGTNVELIGQQDMAMMSRTGQGRSGQGLEMHWMEVALAVDESVNSIPRLPYVVASCVSCSVRSSALHPIRRVHRGCNCTAAHAYARKWVQERSIAADERAGQGRVGGRCRSGSLFGIGSCCMEAT